MNTITRPVYLCSECEGTYAQLYITPRNDGHNVQIVHACEHLIREWYPTAPELPEPAPPHPAWGHSLGAHTRTPGYSRAIEDIATYMTKDEVNAVLGRVQQAQTPWHERLYSLLRDIDVHRTEAPTGQRQPF